MFSVCPGIDVASHAPFEIVFSSSLTHSTEGWGNPFAAHRKRKWSPSRTTTDLGLSVPYSAAFEIRKWLFEWLGKKCSRLLAIDGGISNSLVNVPFTLTFHRLIPGTPFEPSFPCLPVRPLVPVRPINLKRRKKIESAAYSSLKKRWSWRLTKYFNNEKNRFSTWKCSKNDDKLFLTFMKKALVAKRANHGKRNVRESPFQFMHRFFPPVNFK